ncbi:MAG: ATP-binding cassette domain-containing protein [Peptococcales bacterium]|jgi:NitT/TauT family transport system ATP-binding protein
MTIVVDKITKSYGEKIVLDNVSMKLRSGQVTSLMGQSGSGKTTLAHILLGLTKPNSGKIEGLTGKSLAAVFQENRLCEGLSLMGNIRLVLKNKIEDEKILKEMKEVGLEEETAYRPVSQLSGGQKRRVAILRAVMAESDFLILDEPFKGLDKETKEKTMTYVKKSIIGKTVLLITHDYQEAQFFGGEKLELD